MRRIRKRRYKTRGFTLIETVVIAGIISIFALFAMPGFSSMLDAIRLDQSVTEVRASLSQAQRYAIRNQQSCTASLLLNHSDSDQPSSNIPPGSYLDCLPTQSQTLPRDFSMMSNIVPVDAEFDASDTPKDSKDEKVDKDKAEKDAAWCERHPQLRDWHHKCTGSNKNGATIVETSYEQDGHAAFQIQSKIPSPVDPSGKVVVYNQERPQSRKKCIAISRRIGLARVGTYTGSLEPSLMTDEGICTALEWKDQ